MSAGRREKEKNEGLEDIYIKEEKKNNNTEREAKDTLIAIPVYSVGLLFRAGSSANMF
jgi:hypothetical protein